ncbi:hypothetical protein C8R45DRAFT_946857 [Mycena sanguinolenta]|nr:hypothetical protein C8R45DRAFT_946857 [Mycena sanguinolenta]
MPAAVLKHILKSQQEVIDGIQTLRNDKLTLGRKGGSCDGIKARGPLVQDREMECENQVHVWRTQTADSRIKQLLSEWDPRQSEGSTPENLPGAEGQALVKEGVTIFPAPEGLTHLSQGLRVLTQRKASLVYGKGDPHNRSFRIPDAWDQSLYVADFVAALEAVRQTSTVTALTIVSSQEYIHNVTTNKLMPWENEGWVGVCHWDVMKALATTLKARQAKTVFMTATLGAKRQAESGRAVPGDLTAPKDTALPGIQLQGNRQRNFYKGIWEEKAKSLVQRKSMKKNLDAFKGYMKEIHE